MAGVRPIPRFELDIPFKGARQYVHASDIFNELVALTKWRGGVSLHFHRPIRCSIEAAELAAGESGSGPDALFWYGPADRRRCLALRGNPERPVTARRPYDEALVVADAVMDPPWIRSAGPGNASFIERVLALNKVLLNRQFSVAGGRWWFARLDLDRVPENAVRIELLSRRALGARMTKSHIVVDGLTLGSVFFSAAMTAE